MFSCFKKKYTDYNTKVQKDLLSKFNIKFFFEFWKKYDTLFPLVEFRDLSKSVIFVI
jgi:hypothetical protein